MENFELAISPIQLAQQARDYWGHYDAYIASQLAAIGCDKCYQPKFYKAPASADEYMQPGASVQYGLKITPGSLLLATCLPADPVTGSAPPFIVQVRDQSLRHNFWDEPIPSFFLGNAKLCGLSANPLLLNGAILSEPNWFPKPYPVVGDGAFMCSFWKPGSVALRVELVFFVAEVVGK